MSHANHTIFVEHVRKEAACYGLPYGGIGFASHIITYYTMAALYFGCQPLRPTRRLEHRGLDFILAAIQFVVTVILSSVVIGKCHDQWPFVLIAVWMLTTSISLSALNIAGPFIAGKRTEGPIIGIIVSIIWLGGCIVGFVGLMAIVSRLHDNNRSIIISGVFGGIIFLGVVFDFGACIMGKMSGAFALCLLWPIIGICSLGLLWMDWALGAILGNLAGVPNKSNSAIY